MESLALYPQNTSQHPPLHGGCFSISFCPSWSPRAVTPGISGLMHCGLSLHALPEPSGRKCCRWTGRETIRASENCPVSLRETPVGLQRPGVALPPWEVDKGAPSRCGEGHGSTEYFSRSVSSCFIVLLVV